MPHGFITIKFCQLLSWVSTWGNSPIKDDDHHCKIENCNLVITTKEGRWVTLGAGQGFDETWEGAKWAKWTEKTINHYLIVGSYFFVDDSHGDGVLNKKQDKWHF